MEELIEQRLPPGVRLSPPHGHELNTRKWSTIYTSFSEEITFAMATQRSENPKKKRPNNKNKSRYGFPLLFSLRGATLRRATRMAGWKWFFFFFYWVSLLGFAEWLVSCFVFRLICATSFVSQYLELSFYRFFSRKFDIMTPRCSSLKKN